MSKILSIQKNNQEKIDRPWGHYLLLVKTDEYLIKQIVILPKKSISLQKHNHRSEHWLISQGKPKITLNKKEFTMKPDETIFIPKGSIHRIENPNNEQVKIIEAQVGSILRETDIIRFEDKYGRVSK